MKKLVFGMVAIFAGIGAANAAGDPCLIISSMQGVFKTLRTLAFVGAGFIIATWAWGMISDPDKNKPMEVAKTKGVSMIVGFVLLFSVGLVLNFLGPITGCANIVSGW